MFVFTTATSAIHRTTYVQLLFVVLPIRTVNPGPVRLAVESWLSYAECFNATNPSRFHVGSSALSKFAR